MTRQDLRFLKPGRLVCGPGILEGPAHVKILRPSTLVEVIAKHPWSSLRDGLLLSGVMAFAVLVALHYDLFAFISSLAGPDRKITPAEGVLLSGLFVLCVYVFIARRFDQQRYDAGRRAELEREMRVLRELAMQDPLTKLPNRRALLTALQEALTSPRDGDLRHVFFMLDLNGFKAVNDAVGHAEGDEVLRKVVERLLRAMRPSDVLARLGGDEFGVIAYNVDAKAAVAVGTRFADALSRVIRTGGRLHPIGVAIGAAIIPDDGDTVEKILHNADLAMYRAKAEGKSAVVFCDPLCENAQANRKATG